MTSDHHWGVSRSENSSIRGSSSQWKERAVFEFGPARSATIAKPGPQTARGSANVYGERSVRDKRSERRLSNAARRPILSGPSRRVGARERVNTGRAPSRAHHNRHRCERATRADDKFEKRSTRTHAPFSNYKTDASARVCVCLAGWRATARVKG